MAEEKDQFVRDIPVPKNWKSMEHHHLAEIVPFGTGIDLAALTAHMKSNGYDASERITIRKGTIGDGRHRRHCAIEAGVVPTFQEHTGTDAQFREFVRKKQIRQHMDASMLAMHAAKLLLDERNDPAFKKDEESAAKTVAAAAAAVNVSPRAMAYALNVAEDGSKKLQEAVAGGVVKVTDAAKIVDQPAKVQNQAVKDVAEGKSTTVAGAVARMSVTCDRCKRVGIRPDCKSCEEERKKFDSAEKRKALKAAKDRKAKANPKVDDFGNPVPSHLRDAWEDPWIQKAYDFIAVAGESWRSERLSDGMNKRKKHYPFFNADDFLTGCSAVSNTIDQLVEHLKKNRPAGVCPACEGKSCAKCKESGLVPRDVYLALKKDKK